MVRLREAYGRPLPHPHRAPVDELILTVLSQNTNDRNRDVAYMRLRERFPTWEAVRRAPEDEIEEAIRPGGISRVKSARIQAILRAIGDDGEEVFLHASAGDRLAARMGGLGFLARELLAEVPELMSELGRREDQA